MSDIWPGSEMDQKKRLFVVKADHGCRGHLMRAAVGLDAAEGEGAFAVA